MGVESMMEIPVHSPKEQSWRKTVKFYEAVVGNHFGKIRRIIFYLIQPEVFKFPVMTLMKEYQKSIIIVGQGKFPFAGLFKGVFYNSMFVRRFCYFLTKLICYVI
jgi:hypothetical protein